MPRDDALKFVEILEKSEVYERKYWSLDKRKEKGMDTDYTYHVYPNEKEYTMRVVTDQHYNMAKLAGKPEKD
jgi:hypothetical protein